MCEYIHACMLDCVHLLYLITTQKISNLEQFAILPSGAATTPGNGCWWACHHCLAMIILYILIPSHMCLAIFYAVPAYHPLLQSEGPLVSVQKMQISASKERDGFP